MAIYVDEPRYYGDVSWPASRWGHMWSHLWADFEDLETLHELALKIGLKRRNFQDNAVIPHYDLIPSKRELAIKEGAILFSTKVWFRENMGQLPRG